MTPKPPAVRIPDTFCHVYEPVWISRREALGLRPPVVSAIDDSNAAWMAYCAGRKPRPAGPGFCDAYVPVRFNRLESGRVRPITREVVDGNNAVWMEICGQ